MRTTTLRRKLSFLALTFLVFALSLFACKGPKLEELAERLTKNEERTAALERALVEAGTAHEERFAALERQLEELGSGALSNADRLAAVERALIAAGDKGGARMVLHAAGAGPLVTGEQRFKLYTRLLEDAIDWTPTSVPANTWTTIYTAPAPAVNEVNVYAALAVLSYDMTDAAVNCDAGQCDAILRRYVPGRYAGGDFCRPDGVCASAGSFDVAEDSFTPPSSAAIMNGAQARISWSGSTLVLQAFCPSTCKAAGGISAQREKPFAVSDAGVSDSGSDAADAADANDGSDAGPPPGAMTVSQTGISPLQTTTNGPLAGSQALTFTVASNASTVTSCAVCGVNVTSLSCGSSTCTGSSASLTGVNAGAAQLCNATCTNPGGTTTCTNCYFALPACSITNLRGDALVLSGTTILGAVNLAGGVQWDAGGSPTVATTSIGSLNGQLGIHTAAAGTLQDLFGPSLAGIDAGRDLYVWSPNASGNQCHGFSVMGTANSITCFSFSGGVYADNLATTRQASGISLALTVDAGYVWDFESTSAVWTLIVNGSTIKTTATNTVSGPTNPAIGNAASGQSDDEVWGEKLTTNCDLSAADLTAVKAYFNFRYGLNFN